MFPRTGRGRPRRFALPRSGEALADARLDFAEALFDLRTPLAVAALDRVAVARTLAELWDFREAIFSLVACRHDQGEASRRLASLDRHFPRRQRRAAFAPLAND
ncbi:MAG: hypothetical protein ABIO71_10620 [Caldimonas sp.]